MIHCLHDRCTFRMYVYVLKLEKGKYYVGKTSSPTRRLEEHISGSGSRWTSIYKPISVVKVIPMTSPFDEDKITKEYMASKGIENVRGGSYVEVDIHPQDLSHIQREIWTSTNCCLRCGRNNHFVNNCFARSDINGYMIEDSDEITEKCFRCGRVGHYANDCFATWHCRGYMIDDSESEYDDDES